MHARVVRALVFLVPIAGSVVFVHVASRAIEMPTSAFVLFVTWWVVLSAAAMTAAYPSGLTLTLG